MNGRIHASQSFLIRTHDFAIGNLNSQNSIAKSWTSDNNDWNAIHDSSTQSPNTSALSKTSKAKKNPRTLSPPIAFYLNQIVRTCRPLHPFNQEEWCIQQRRMESCCQRRWNWLGPYHKLGRFPWHRDMSMSDDCLYDHERDGLLRNDIFWSRSKAVHELARSHKE